MGIGFSSRNIDDREMHRLAGMYGPSHQPAAQPHPANRLAGAADARRALREIAEATTS